MTISFKLQRLASNCPAPRRNRFVVYVRNLGHNPVIVNFQPLGKPPPPFLFPR